MSVREDSTEIECVHNFPVDLLSGKGDLSAILCSQKFRRNELSEVFTTDGTFSEDSIPSFVPSRISSLRWLIFVIFVLGRFRYFIMIGYL